MIFQIREPLHKTRNRAAANAAALLLFYCSPLLLQLEGISQIGTTIAKNSDVIAHNTAAAAYYAKKNAELTNAMGYLVALR